MKHPHEELLSTILSHEHRMFITVRSSTPAPCQENAESFRIFRASHFAGWSKGTLDSYLKNLEDSYNSGRNLMMLKYARMDNLIPKLHKEQDAYTLIDNIVLIQKKWQMELLSEYPQLILRGRPISQCDKESNTTSFENYLRCELETYSLDTLRMLLADIKDWQSKNRNMTKMSYLSMIEELGYTSLEEANDHCARYLYS